MQSLSSYAGNVGNELISRAALFWSHRQTENYTRYCPRSESVDICTEQSLSTLYSCRMSNSIVYESHIRRCHCINFAIWDTQSMTSCNDLRSVIQQCYYDNHLTGCYLEFMDISYVQFPMHRMPHQLCPRFGWAVYIITHTCIIHISAEGDKKKILY